MLHEEVRPQSWGGLVVGLSIAAIAIAACSDAESGGGSGDTSRDGGSSAGGQQPLGSSGKVAVVGGEAASSVEGGATAVAGAAGGAAQNGGSGSSLTNECPEAKPLDGDQCDLATEHACRFGQRGDYICDCLNPEGKWRCACEAGALQECKPGLQSGDPCTMDDPCFCWGTYDNSSSGNCVCANNTWTCMPDESCPATRPAHGTRCSATAPSSCLFGEDACSCDAGFWRCRTESCPASTPVAGSSCSERQTCDYGKASCTCPGEYWPFWLCGAQECPAAAPQDGAACNVFDRSCSFSGADCSCASSTSLPEPPDYRWSCSETACPASKPTSGTECTYSDNDACAYGTASCVCRQPSFPGTWECLACPTSEPAPGDSCTLPSAQCAYGEISCQCGKGGWHCQ